MQASRGWGVVFRSVAHRDVRAQLHGRIHAVLNTTPHPRLAASNPKLPHPKANLTVSKKLG